ncbi:hypothetical protein AtubIFM57258_004643 [Aspergillus tubingensis]|nr:hypothetical protein AtubIFM57258_004643 [Aspergillus tubingensis]
MKEIQKRQPHSIPQDLPIYRPNGRALGVAFDHVTVTGRAQGDRTVLDLPTLLQRIATTPLKVLYTILGNKPKSTRNLVYDVSGVVFPGETMLVLGRPGSGCTTTLKAISSHIDSFEGIQGSVNYAWMTSKDVKKTLRSEVVYSSEDDMHFPTLPVKDTLDFALRLRKPTHNPMSDLEFAEKYTNLLLSSFGILRTKNTIVGDSFIRGVSGGERRRISLAEMMTINPALACWDNPIRGLDSSSALEFLQLLKHMSQSNGMANVVTLYQASESMYQNCFDRTLVLYEGRMIFSGKAQDAKSYFEGLGFYCPQRQTTPDFLTSITSPAERRIRDDYQGPRYLDPDSLAAAFRESSHYHQLQSDIKAYHDLFDGSSTEHDFHQDVRSIRSKFALPNSTEPATIAKQVWVGTKRYYKILWGDRNTFFTIVALCIVNAVITGSGFYHAPKTASGSFERSGALFFAGAYFCLNALTEVVKTVNARSVLLKQHDFGFIHPVAYAVIQTLADIPSALIQTTVFSCCYYFIIGLSLSASQFFIFVLICFIHYSAISSMFRMIGAWSPSLNVSHLLAGCALPVACLYSGYAPPVPTMHRWGSWIRRITPTPYAIEALMGNEFYNIVLQCTPSQLIPSGPGYNDLNHQACPMSGAKSGSAKVAGSIYLQETYDFTRSHLWRNFGIILAMWFLYMVLTAVGLVLMTRDSKGGGGPVFKRTRKGEPDTLQQENTRIDDVEKQMPVSSARNSLTMSESTTRDNSDSGSQVSRPTEESNFNFTFNNLNYFVGPSSDEKQLLNNVCGYVKPGQLTALMGASGAGKTTLLDNLSQRKAEGRTTGDICVNGSSPGPSFARSCGFCMQQDIHEPNATVREAFQFSAMLRQASHVPKQEKLDYAEYIISLLELEHLADALIGTTGDGQLNVEERKRVTIGVELAARPSALLFLDEPTSGLDSQAAFSIVSFLRKIAAEGIPIVCTIHQPSGVLFEMFDHVLLLAPGGRTIYFGETGTHASTIGSYFARHGAVMAPEDNPAEFIISAVAKGDRDWPQTWIDSPESAILQEQILKLNAAKTPAPDGPVQKGPAGLQNHMLGILLSTWVIPTLAVDIQAIWFEKWSIFEARERNGIYDFRALLTALIAVELPWVIIIFTLIFFCTYWTFGFFSTPSIAGFVYFMYLLLSIFGLGFSYLMASLFHNGTMAGYANSLFWVVLLMFSGAANPRSALNSFYHPWLFWADPLTFFFEPTVSTVLHGVNVTCGSSDLAVFNPPSGQTCGQYLKDYMERNPGYLENPAATQNCGYCKYSLGDDYAKTLNYYYADRWRDWAVFLGFCITNYILVYLVTWIHRVKMRQWRK